MARKSTGKRLRFEIFKRDGFRCRYCGANASAVTLHIDHVVPVSKGGSDDPANLVTACADCNGGKSNVDLHKSGIPDQQTTEAALEHAEQIKAYLAAQKKVERAKKQLVKHVVERWEDGFSEPPPPSFVARLPAIIAKNGLDIVVQAVDVLVNADHVNRGARIGYFFGILKGITRDREGVR